MCSGSTGERKRIAPPPARPGSQKVPKDDACYGQGHSRMRPWGLQEKEEREFFVRDPGPSYKRVEAIQEPWVGSCVVAASSSIFLFLWEPAIDISRSLTCPDRSWRTCWSNHHLGHYALQAQEVELGSLGVNDGAGELGCEHELSWGPTTSPKSWVSFMAHLLWFHGDHLQPSEVIIVSALWWLTPGTKHIFEEKVQYMM